MNQHPVRLAVIGGGQMGANHVRVAARTSGVELVGVVEIDDAKRTSLAQAAGVDSAATIEELLTTVTIDAVVVATPTAFHHAIAVNCLNLGLHVLVEKPIALTPEQGKELERRAESAGLVLTVGHIERFNPAITELCRSTEIPIHIELVRIGPFTPRVSDDVVMDLMIHDLDLARTLAKSEVAALSSIQRSTRTTGPDMAIALLTFENGVTASVTASRIGQQKLRRVTVTQEEAVLAADLIRQDVMIHRMQHVEYVSAAGARYRQSGVVEIPFIENRGEPLMLELEAFAASVHGAEPVVTAGDGTRALELARSVLAGRLDPLGVR